MAMAVEHTDGRRSIGALLRDLAEGSAGLVRGEARIASVELTALISAISRGTAWMAIGGVLALVGALSVLAGLILLVGDQWLPDDLYWVGALLVLIISGAVALWLANRGRHALAPSGLAPDQTLETLKEDTEWLKRRMTSGATSN